MTDTKEISFEDVKTWERRLTNLRGDLEEEEAIVRSLSAKLATLYRDGADRKEIEKVSRQQSESTAKVEAMKEAIKALEANIEDANREACRGAAEEAIGSARKRVGGIAGRFPSDLERAGELVEELGSVLARLTGARDRQLWHVTDAEALAAEFGLAVEVSDFKLLDTAAEGRVEKLRERIRTLADADNYPSAVLQGVDAGAPPKALRTRQALRNWGDESQSAPILERLGRELKLSTSGLKDLERAMRQHQKTTDREAAIEAVMEWLRPRIAQGPAPCAELHEKFAAEIKNREKWPEIGGGMGTLSVDKALVLAAERLELVRAKDGSGNHFWAPGDAEAHGLTPCSAFE